METIKKRLQVTAVVIGVIFCISGLSSCQTFVAQPSEAILPDQSPDPNKNRIVCIGGSAVRGTGSFGPEFQSWPSLMARFLFFRGLEYEVVNATFGAGGTRALADSLDPLLDDRDALIILDTGENDIDLWNKPGGVFPPLVPIKARIQGLIDKIKARNIPFVLLRPNFPEFNDYMAQFTQMYVELGRENNIPVVDCMPPGLFYSLGMRGPDGKHFNEIAYSKIAAYTLHKLNPAFNPSADELFVANQTVIEVPWIQYLLEHPGQLGE